METTAKYTVFTWAIDDEISVSVRAETPGEAQTKIARVLELTGLSEGVDVDEVEPWEDDVDEACLTYPDGREVTVSRFWESQGIAEIADSDIAIITTFSEIEQWARVVDLRSLG